MNVNWNSVKSDGYPPKAGRYMVTIEGVIDDVIENVINVGERGVTEADYYGDKAWGLHEGIYRIVAWAEFPEPYQGE